MQKAQDQSRRLKEFILVDTHLMMTDGVWSVQWTVNQALHLHLDRNRPDKSLKYTSPLKNWPFWVNCKNLLILVHFVISGRKKNNKWIKISFADLCYCSSRIMLRSIGDISLKLSLQVVISKKWKLYAQYSDNQGSCSYRRYKLETRDIYDPSRPFLCLLSLCWGGQCPLTSLSDISFQYSMAC